MDSITATDAPSTPKPGLFINRNFALLWTGGAISVFGDVIFDTSLIVWISAFLAAHQSWAPLAVSGVLLAALIPTIVFGPIAGVFVDRWDKRRTMLAMDASRAVLIALLLIVTIGKFSMAGQLAAIYTVVFLASICSQLFGPARLALIGDIVAAPQQAQASSMSQMTQSLAFLIAPPLAPILLLAVGPQIALLINALSFACSFVTLLAVRAPKAATSRDAGARPNFLREFVAGLTFAVQNRVILTLLITTSVIMLGASALNALDIFFVRDNLHAPLNLYGFLETAQGVGAILGAVLTGMLAKKIGMARLLVVSLFLLSLCLLLYSRLSSLVPALIVIFFGGVVVAAANILAGPLLLRVTPRAYIGRVVATINPTSAVMQVLGTTLAGFLASNVLLGFHAQALGLTFGPIDTIFTGGAALALVGAFYALLRLGFTDPPAVVEEASDSTTAAPLAETAPAG
jgi:MFS family permease